MMDETQGQICDREMQPERDGKGGGMDGGEKGVCVNDMVICTQRSSDVIKAMI